MLLVSSIHDNTDELSTLLSPVKYISCKVSVISVNLSDRDLRHKVYHQRSNEVCVCMSV